MLQKAEKKLKSENKDDVIAPWQSTSITNAESTESKNNTVETKVGTKSTESKNNVETKVGTKSTESKNNVETKVGTKSTESKNNVETKVGTKSTESKNNVETKVGTKSTESKNNVETKVGTKSTESKNNVETKVGTKSTESKNNVETKVGTKSTESKNNVETKVGTNLGNKLYYNIQYLSGLQLDLMRYIYKNKFQEQKKYYIHLNTNNAAIESGITLDKFRVSLRRIENKKIIIRESGVMGRHGFSIFNIPNDSIKYFAQFHLTESGNKQQNQPPIYNNTITINKNNNTNDQKTDSTEKDNLIAQMQQQISELQKQQSQLNQPQSVEVKKDQSAKIEDVTVTELNENDWLDLDYSSLTEFGFKKSHVNQIKKFNAKLDANSQLTVDSVQDSIEHYAWALRNKLSEMENYAPSTNRLRGLLGVLKRGGEWVEPNYKSPEDLAYEASLKAKKERLEKIKAQKDELFMLEFEMWRDGLSDEQLAEVEEKGKLKAAMPPSAFKNKGDNTYYVNALKSYYKKNEYKG